MALVLFRTGKHLRAFEELNTAVLSAKEHSLNDVYVRCKLLEIEMNHSLGFYSKCVLSLQSRSLISSRTGQRCHDELKPEQSQIQRT